MLSEMIGKFVRVMRVVETDSIIVGNITAVDMLKDMVLVTPAFGQAKWVRTEHIELLRESDL